MHVSSAAVAFRIPSIACPRPCPCLREVPAGPKSKHCLTKIAGRLQYHIFNSRPGTSLRRVRSHNTGLQAVRASRAVEDWSSLAAVSPEEDYVPEDDPVFQEDINRLCNVGLKAMVKEDGRAVSEWQDELNSYGAHFAEENNREATVFIFTLYEMSEHKLPTESLQLKGMYLKAFGKMFNVLEDSGWQLKSPDDSDDGAEDK